MRVSQDEKDRSHLRIVDSAARLVRERGIGDTGVADVMAAAGLTHGGFYRHFETKEALLVAAIDAAFDEIVAMLAVSPEASASGDAVAGFERLYLSAEHVGNPGFGCPVAALAGDVARASAVLKRSFSEGVARIVASLARGMKGSEQRRRDLAARRLAMMAGAVMIARASDAETAKIILDACK